MGDNGDGTFSDGDFHIARPIGPVVYEKPFPDLDVACLLHQPYMQLAAAWESLPWDTVHPDVHDFKLVDESTPNADGALVTWDRTFAKVPPNRQVPEMFAWGLQFYTTGSSVSITEVGVSLLSQIYYRYGTEAEMLAIPPLRARKVVEIAGGLYWLGSPDESRGRVAEDSKVRQWRGNIWEYSVRFITVPAVGDAIS